MHYRATFTALSLLGTSIAATIPSEPWTTLTPDSKPLDGALTDYSNSFGIAINPFTTGGNALTAGAKEKRDAVSQIGDGQIQAATTTAAAISQIGDGQIQAATATAAAISQIGDGQIQAATATAAAISQIGDGQIQAPTATAAAISQIGDGQIQAPTATAAAISQIGDGQIQAPTGTAAAISQIGDGQIQAPTGTVAAISQIGDGQIQATTGTAVSQISDGQIQATATKTAASEITDGQVQKPTGSALAADEENSVAAEVACKSDSTLTMTLKGGQLVDSKGRIGSIVANRQFQFDGPPPQAGAIYAAGWSVTDDGKLALGDQTVFYECLSGTFYNIYDEHIGDQCKSVELDIVDLISC